MDNYSNKCDVIVTYCWNRVGYNIIRSLSDKGLKVWVADTSKCNICSMSKFSAGSFVYPDPFKEEQAFIDCLLHQIDLLRPQVLLPTHDESFVIALHRDEFPSWLTIPIADYDLMKLLSNKKTATELAGKIGIPIPKIYNRTEDVVYPCVFKTVIGNSAKSVFFPSDESELNRLVKAYAGDEFLVEEKCSGIDYSVDCIRYGEHCYVSTYKSTLTKTKGGGTSTQREIVSFPKLENYAKLLLKAVDYNGVCGMDFKYDEQTSRIAFIEVNTRYTGGLATPIAAGFDIPYIHYCLATKGAYPYQVDVRIGTRTKWILGDLITLVGRLLSMRLTWSEVKQIFSFKGFSGFDDYRKDDKRAFWGELHYYLNKLLKNKKLNP